MILYLKHLSFLSYIFLRTYHRISLYQRPYITLAARYASIKTDQINSDTCHFLVKEPFYIEFHFYYIICGVVIDVKEINADYKSVLL